LSELTTYERRKGKEIQARLRRKSGHSQFKTRDLVVEVHRLMEQPYQWPIDLIAQALGLTTRRIRQVLKEQADIEARATAPTSIEEKYRRMLDWSVDAFETFFNTFSYEGQRKGGMPRHVRPWIAAFLRERNLLLNVPPRHAKSIFFMVWLPIWLICRDRNVQVLLVSKTHEFAQNWALEIAKQLENNEELFKAFGRFAPEKEGDQKWKPNTGTFTVHGRTKTAGGSQFTVESRGMNGQVLGREADFVIVDDPTDQEDAASETARKRALKHLREQVFTRAEPEGDSPGGRIAVVGQRVHLLDLYGALEKQEYEIGPLIGQKLFHTEKYPAVLNWDTKRVLWPGRFGWDEIMLLYARSGGHGPFSCLYQQEPLPEGSALVTSAWIEGCKDHDRPARTGMRGDKGEPGFLPIVRVVSVDPSPTKFNGIIVGDLLCHKENFHFAVTEVVRMKASVRELKAEVDRIVESQKPDYFIFEESGFLRWFRDDPWFEHIKNRVRLKLHRTGVNKNSMDYGVQSLAGDFEFARISLPYGDDIGRRMTDMLANEALVYPDGDTSDLLMALWFIKFNYQKLSPVHHLPTRRKGGKGQGGWSFLAKMRSDKNTQDEAYRRWRRAQSRRNAAENQEEMRKVSVG